MLYCCTSTAKWVITVRLRLLSWALLSGALGSGWSAARKLVRTAWCRSTWPLLFCTNSASFWVSVGGLHIVFSLPSTMGKDAKGQGNGLVGVFCSLLIALHALSLSKLCIVYKMLLLAVWAGLLAVVSHVSSALLLFSYSCFVMSRRLVQFCCRQLLLLFVGQSLFSAHCYWTCCVSYSCLRIYCSLV